MKTNRMEITTAPKPSSIIACFKFGFTQFATICILALVVFGQKSQATVLLTEDFTYTAGTLLTANGWTAHSGGGANAQTVIAPSPALTSSGYANGGGNAVALTTSGEDDNKTLSASQSSGSNYMAFLVYCTNAQTAGDYFIHFYQASTTFGGKVFIKKDSASANIAFGVSKVGNTPTYTGFTYSTNTTYLVVLKYVFNTGTTTDDSVSLFINPTPGVAEPSATISGVTDASTDLTSISAAALRQGASANAPSVRVDGIRVGTTWLDAAAASCNTPVAQTVTGGSGCTGTGGVTVGLNSSETGVNYQLLKDGSNVGSVVAGTGAAISFGSQTAAGTYTVTAATALGSCTATMTGNAIVSTTVTPSVTVAQSPSGSVCASSTVIFTATPVNGGTPTYVWTTNGTIVTGVTGNKFTNNTPVNNETIDCRMTSTATCATPPTADATQITLTVTAQVTPSVTVASSSGTSVCASSNVTFTATPVNGGTPTYQWKTNGTAVTGQTSVTWTTSTLINGDVVTVVMTSTDPCASTPTATSSALTMTVNPLLTPSVTIGVTPSSTVCSNTTVTFTATPVNGGSTPGYQWKTNGVSVPNETNATYVTAKILNTYTVTVVMTPSSDVCVNAATATSSGITMTVNPNSTPSVTVGVSPGNTICSGTTVTFTATPVNGGASPTYQWRKNGTAIAGETASTFVSSTITNGDVISVVLTPSSDICVLPATATSANQSMSVNSFGIVTSTVFSENMGTTATGNPLVSVFTGWQSSSPITFGSSTTAKPDVRTTTASSGYSGASGGDNIFYSSTTGARDFIISNINTLGLTSLQLSFGLKADSLVGGDPFVVEVSSDGVTYSALTFTQPNSTFAWTLITPTGTIPATSNLRIRFSKNTTSSWRLDDVKLQSVATSASVTGSGKVSTGNPGILTATANGTAYLWSPGGETTASISVTAADTYSVTISDANGCNSTASRVVASSSIPTTSTGQAISVTNSMGGVTASFAGVPGFSYTVQRATNINFNVGVVVDLKTTNAPVGGLFNTTDSFSDLGGTPPTEAYYRLRYNP